MAGLPTIKRRQDFLAASAQGKRFVTSCFVVQYAKRSPDHPAGKEARIGFTVTKKMGGAVQRNRIRRRLREALKHAKPPLADNYDYVIISRQKALDCDFADIVRDIGFAFSKIATT